DTEAPFSRALESSETSPEIKKELRAIDAILEAESAPSFEGNPFWDNASLDTDSRWLEIRERASALVELFQIECHSDLKNLPTFDSWEKQK
ncbi:MAG: hypothetical protein AAFY59_11855, partial [Pseudomonadota bacterium]